MMMLYLCGVSRGWGQELAAHAVHRVTQTLIVLLLEFQARLLRVPGEIKSSDYHLLVLLAFLRLLIQSKFPNVWQAEE